MQNVLQKIFGGVFGASQLLQIAERRIPFQMVYDTFEKLNKNSNEQWYSGYPENTFGQRALSISGHDRFKLLPAAEGKNCYALETGDGKLLNLNIEPTKEPCEKEEIDIGHELSVSERASVLTPNFLFALRPQPDGRVVFQSSSNGKFIRFFDDYGEGIGTYLRGYKNNSHNEELADATKFSFVTQREGTEQTQATAADWSPIFGGLAVSEQIEELAKFSMPFFMLAVDKKERFYVNVQKEYTEASDDDPYYFVEAQGEPNTFNFVSIGGGSDGEGTNRLIYAGNGEYLSVCKFSPKLSSAELMFDSETGAPMSKFLFDFIPRSQQTFVIRSLFNDKFVRIKYFDKYSDVDEFAIDATSETAAEFVLSPISMLSSLHDNEPKVDEAK